MERVYLDKEEFQNLVNNSCEDVTFNQITEVIDRDPELEGLRTFEFTGIQYIEKRVYEE
jgi:hypothetical protein